MVILGLAPMMTYYAVIFTVGNSGRGRYPAGRGGFRSDSFRGRETLVVVGPTVGTTSETRASFLAGPRAQVDVLERVINVSIKTEVGELVVKVVMR
ncbi:hypothetical protein Acr_23g0005450 [Actinidia rufa]|uniref:Uncharacterized protein n=1 Tax=Actinidia rufa TaxID=165716 RepID=A0A7J0GMZ6_9ERIC|nr:hypothetical protein Acr_23g0005450 [Actinidia rufa]